MKQEFFSIEQLTPEYTKRVLVSNRQPIMNLINTGVGRGIDTVGLERVAAHLLGAVINWHNLPRGIDTLKRLYEHFDATEVSA